MTRQRQVFPRDTVSHLWAHAAQDSARDPCGNFYFNGPALHSYGSHHVIAYRYPCADGRVAYLFNADTYSATTSRHHYIARRAIPRSAYVYEIDGLRADSFSRAAWRARMMREALQQAGNAYAAAAVTARKSQKREAYAGAALARMNAAEFLARDVLARKDSDADDKREARATLRTLAKVPAWDREADNTAQRDTATAAAKVLALPSMKAAALEKLERAARYLERAQDENSGARHRWQCARDAANIYANAADLARRYGFRIAKLAADPAKLAESLAPMAQAEATRDAASEAVRFLRIAERDRRARGYSAAHYLGRAEEYAQNAGDALPGYMRDRITQLAERARRADAIEAAAESARMVAGHLKSADSYADAGHARDAVREYSRAIRYAENARAALPATHPALHRIDAADIERAREYVRDADARMAAENAEHVAAWRAGGAARFHAYNLAPLLRLSADGRTIETSRGASVPVAVAPMIWAASNACRDSGTAHNYGKQAPRIGSFALDVIHADGSITAGCHEIARAELEYIAAQLGYSAA